MKLLCPEHEDIHLSHLGELVWGGEGAGAAGLQLSWSFCGENWTAAGSLGRKVTAVIYGDLCQLIADLREGGTGPFVRLRAAIQARAELEGTFGEVGR